jgi:hypothetical protein
MLAPTYAASLAFSKGILQSIPRDPVLLGMVPQARVEGVGKALEELLATAPAGALLILSDDQAPSTHFNGQSALDALCKGHTHAERISATVTRLEQSLMPAIEALITDSTVSASTTHREVTDHAARFVASLSDLLRSFTREMLIASIFAARDRLLVQVARCEALEGRLGNAPDKMLLDTDGAPK